MSDTVDIADLEKQHEELGEMIAKLKGSDDEPEPVKKIERVKLKEESVVAKGKKKPPANSDAEDVADGGDDEAFEDDSNPSDTKKKPPKSVKKDSDVEPEVKKDEVKIDAVKKEEPVAVVAVADEEIVFKGQTIKKSAVGEIQFGLVKSMSEELTKNTADIAKAQDDALTAKLEKRADDEFAHVPGTTAERASMLKALSKMEEPLRKSFEAVFTQSEKLAKSAFDTLGTKGGDSEDIKKSGTDFLAKVEEIKKRDSVGKAAAMTKARAEHPELFKAYQQASN